MNLASRTELLYELNNVLTLLLPLLTEEELIDIQIAMTKEYHNLHNQKGEHHEN